MVSPLVFYQLGLIALVWVFLMLYGLWPSEPAAARPMTSKPLRPGASTPKSPSPFRVSPVNLLALLVSRRLRFPGYSHLLLHPRRLLQHEAAAVTVPIATSYRSPYHVRSGWLRMVR